MQMSTAPTICVSFQAPTGNLMCCQVEATNDREAGTPSPMSTGSGDRPGDSDEQHNNASGTNAVALQGQKGDVGAQHVLPPQDSQPEGWMLKVGQLDKC